MVAAHARPRAFSYFEGSAEERARGLFQLLGDDGTPVDDEAVAGFDRALARQLFEGMLRIRVTDARMMALQRQGRIGFYGEAMGQEAFGRLLRDEMTTRELLVFLKRTARIKPRVYRDVMRQLSRSGGRPSRSSRP